MCVFERLNGTTAKEVAVVVDVVCVVQLSKSVDVILHGTMEHLTTTKISPARIVRTH